VNADDGQTAMPKMEQQLPGVLWRRAGISAGSEKAGGFRSGNVPQAAKTLGRTRFHARAKSCGGDIRSHRRIYLPSAAMQ